MNNLSFYLKKFRLILTSKEDRVKIVSEELSSVLKINIPKEDISIKNGVITIRARPTIKNEIYISKEKILEALKIRGLSEAKELR